MALALNGGTWLVPKVSRYLHVELIKMYTTGYVWSLNTRSLSSVGRSRMSPMTDHVTFFSSRKLRTLFSWWWRQVNKCVCVVVSQVLVSFYITFVLLNSYFWVLPVWNHDIIYGLVLQNIYSYSLVIIVQQHLSFPPCIALHDPVSVCCLGSPTSRVFASHVTENKLPCFLGILLHEFLF